jgi:GT2 family glycosyltransferase
MTLVPNDDDWACFIDHDAMFTTRDWYAQLTHIVQLHPEAGCFTAMTNRVGNPRQVHDYAWHCLAASEDRVRGHFSILDTHHTNHDINYHRSVGAKLKGQFNTEVSPLSDRELMSGVVILTRKSVWSKIRFVSGFLGVDWEYHRGCLKSGHPVYLMCGVYVYHWYRADGDLSHVEPYFHQIRRESPAVK